MERQLAFLLTHAQIPLKWLQLPSTNNNPDGDADIDFQEKLPEDLLDYLSNMWLSAHLRDFGKELGVAEERSLEDVYLSHVDKYTTSSEE
jgi:26S proteasome regulatory subunit N1